MNIFEALEIGNGKAVCPLYDDFVYWKDGYGFCWDRNCNPMVSFHISKRNDWIPYVPRDTDNIWEAYFSLRAKLKKQGFNEDYIDKVISRPNGKCPEVVICSSPLLGKTKHKVVLEDVIWLEDTDSFAKIVYPYAFETNASNITLGSPLRFHQFINKGHTKVTVEWEGKCE